MDDVKSEVQFNAEQDHDAKCANGADCSARDWHVRNDYFYRAVTAMRIKKSVEHEEVMTLLKSLS